MEAEDFNPNLLSKTGCQDFYSRKVPQRFFRKGRFRSGKDDQRKERAEVRSGSSHSGIKLAPYRDSTTNGSTHFHS